jgi:hypothetical protein
MGAALRSLTPHPGIPLALRQFIGTVQRATITSAMRGEEGQYFIDKCKALDTLIAQMPVSYQQDGMGEEAIVTLHYFTAGSDWYITERDIDEGNNGQNQALGFRDSGGLGYISIVELLAHRAELDLYFRPRTRGEVLKARRA